MIFLLSQAASYCCNSICCELASFMNCLQDQQTLDEEVYQAHLTQLLTLFPLRDLESCERPRKTPAPAFQHFIQLLKCPLCEEIMNVPVYLQCSHRVCKNCWLRHKSPGSLIKRCPFCLAPASGQKQPNQDSFLADLIHKIDLWLLKWEEQEFSALKRERESPSTNQEKVKLFKSNDETAIALKKECSQQNQLHLESNKKTNKGEILEWDIKKQEKVTRVLHVVKAQPMATVIPKAHQQLHNAAVGIKAAQILVKIRLQKMANDLITPSLGMEEIVLTCSNQTCIIATLIADHLNISPKLVNLFVKNGPKYKQLHSRDRISHIFSTAQSYHPQSTVLQAFLKSNSAAGPARQNPPFSSLKPSATVYYKIRLSSMELQWPRDMQGS